MWSADRPIEHGAASALVAAVREWGTMPALPDSSTANPGRPSGPIRGLVVLLVAMVTSLVLLIGGPASAESPTRVAEGLEDDGVFVGFGRTDVDEAALAAAVADARADNLDLVVVAPRDPQPSASAFARRVQEQTEADVAMVFPEDGQLEVYVIEDLVAERPRAIEAARVLDDPAMAVATFAEELGSVESSGRPAIIGQIIRALVICSLLIGAVVAIELAIDRVRRTAPAS